MWRRHREQAPPRKLKSKPPRWPSGDPDRPGDPAEAPFCHVSAWLKCPSARSSLLSADPDSPTEPPRGQMEQGCSRASPPPKFMQTQLYKRVFGDASQIERRSVERPESRRRQK